MRIFLDTNVVLDRISERRGDVILTNNVTHFRDFTDIPVLTPADFLSHAQV